MSTSVLRSMLAPVMLFFACLAFACGGGEPPSVSEITLSKNTVRRGEELFASFAADDPDGDLDRAKIAVALRSKTSELEMNGHTNPWGIERGATHANMIVGVTVLGTAPIGMYDLAIIVVDNEENESEEVRVPFRCTQ